MKERREDDQGKKGGKEKLKKEGKKKGKGRSDEDR